MRVLIVGPKDHSIFNVMAINYPQWELFSTDGDTESLPDQLEHTLSLQAVVVAPTERALLCGQRALLAGLPTYICDDDGCLLNLASA